MTIIHDPGNDSELDELFVFCSIDADGKRGIVAHILPSLGATPFVTGSARAMEQMKRMAPTVARASGKRVVLYRYVRQPDEIWSTNG